MDIQSISISKGGPILKELRLVRPYMNIIRNEDMSYNFSDLLKEKEPESPSRPWISVL
jgi:hypothetical protein